MSRRPLRWAQGLLLAVAAAGCGWWLYAAVIAPGVTEAVQGRALERARAALTGGELPPDESATAADSKVGLAAAPATGELIGRLEIPRLGVSSIVLEGDDNRTLRHAVGHLPGTALPGGTGNVALAGHRDAAFAALREIENGDRIRLATAFGDYDYQVTSTAVVGPSALEVLAPSTTPRLTLITCYPFFYLGSAPKRFVVVAEAVFDPA
jgi:sortase A